MRLVVDTSIWVDHIRAPHPILAPALDAARALLHPFVLGEMTLGRALPLGYAEYLDGIDPPEVAEVDEVRRAIRNYGLSGSGIGYVDAHLIASTLLTMDCKLLTRDKRMFAVAERLGIAA